MADENAPDDSGTTEEQHEDDGLTVKPVTDDHEQDSQDMAAAVDAKAGSEDRAEDEALPDGTTWRVVNVSLEGYDDVDDVVATLAAFNDGIQDAEVQMERPSEPDGLGAMLGLE
jgi:hypothetical protein